MNYQILSFLIILFQAVSELKIVELILSFIVSRWGFFIIIKRMYNYGTKRVIPLTTTEVVEDYKDRFPISSLIFYPYIDGEGFVNNKNLKVYMLKSETIARVDKINPREIYKAYGYDNRVWDLFFILILYIMLVLNFNVFYIPPVLLIIKIMTKCLLINLVKNITQLVKIIISLLIRRDFFLIPCDSEKGKIYINEDRVFLNFEKGSKIVPNRLDPHFKKWIKKMLYRFFTEGETSFDLFGEEIIIEGENVLGPKRNLIKKIFKHWGLTSEDFQNPDFVDKMVERMKKLEIEYRMKEFFCKKGTSLLFLTEFLSSCILAIKVKEGVDEFCDKVLEVFLMDGSNVFNLNFMRFVDENKLNKIRRMYWVREGEVEQLNTIEDLKCAFHYNRIKKIFPKVYFEDDFRVYHVVNSKITVSGLKNLRLRKVDRGWGSLKVVASNNSFENEFIKMMLMLRKLGYKDDVISPMKMVVEKYLTVECGNRENNKEVNDEEMIQIKKLIITKSGFTPKGIGSSKWKYLCGALNLIFSSLGYRPIKRVDQRLNLELADKILSIIKKEKDEFLKNIGIKEVESPEANKEREKGNVDIKGMKKKDLKEFKKKQNELYFKRNAANVKEGGEVNEEIGGPGKGEPKTEKPKPGPYKAAILKNEKFIKQNVSSSFEKEELKNKILKMVNMGNKMACKTYKDSAPTKKSSKVFDDKSNNSQYQYSTYINEDKDIQKKFEEEDIWTEVKAKNNRVNFLSHKDIFEGRNAVEVELKESYKCLEYNNEGEFFFKFLLDKGLLNNTIKEYYNPKDRSDWNDLLEMILKIRMKDITISNAKLDIERNQKEIESSMRKKETVKNNKLKRVEKSIMRLEEEVKNKEETEKELLRKIKMDKNEEFRKKVMESNEHVLPGSFKEGVVKVVLATSNRRVSKFEIIKMCRGEDYDVNKVNEEIRDSIYRSFEGCSEEGLDMCKNKKMDFEMIGKLDREDRTYKIIQDAKKSISKRISSGNKGKSKYKSDESFYPTVRMGANRAEWYMKREKYLRTINKIENNKEFILENIEFLDGMGLVEKIKNKIQEISKSSKNDEEIKEENRTFLTRGEILNLVSVKKITDKISFDSIRVFKNFIIQVLIDLKKRFLI